jgi:hypothetical protein
MLNAPVSFIQSNLTTENTKAQAVLKKIDILQLYPTLQFCLKKPPYWQPMALMLY